ncbi:MAG TPA: TRZ/ATZ family hydrolase, partial [Burkholderiales bacterium]|nr:TRZ/ATZ family hydrolase [Burkholderiales bacterium]
MPQHVATLIDAGWVIPVEPRDVLPRHSIAISNETIQAVLPTGEAHARFSAKQHVRLENHALIPGLVNLHTHAAMTLMRGLADDLPLMEWLNKHIWPAETKYVSPQFVRDGTELACAEMLRGGITCFNDMYFFPEAAAEAVLTAGMRAAIGIIVIEFPSSYAGDPEDYLNKGLAARDELRPQPLLSFCMAPHAPYTVSDRTFEKLLTYAQQLDLPIHVHVQETQDEIQQSLAQYKMRPLERLHKLGLLGPNFIAVHAVHLTPQEMALLANEACSVAHCPSSNLKLASGFAPVAALLDHGINVGLGSDGAASNNRLDLFGEMRLAAMLAKAAAKQADALPAYQALQMATLNGAKALGLDGKIGSLAPGKAADITAVDFSGLDLTPCFDPVSHLVYAAGREQVSHVWVNGKLLLDKRQLTTLSTEDISAKTRYW